MKIDVSMGLGALIYEPITHNPTIAIDHDEMCTGTHSLPSNFALNTNIDILKDYQFECMINNANDLVLLVHYQDSDTSWLLDKLNLQLFRQFAQ